MINAKISENGNFLLLSVGETDRDDLRDVYEARGEMAALCEGMESYSCNGSFTPFDAGAANPFVGLTDAPCIAETMDYKDDGRAVIVGRFWYDPHYATRSIVESLCDGLTMTMRRGNY